MYHFGNANGDLDHDGISLDIERLEGLVADLMAVKFPFDCRRLYNERTLSDAPLLEDWRQAVRPVPRLVGFSTGHPLLPGCERPIVTSDIWLFSEELRLARSMSRWYRLGNPFRDMSKDN
ncbi:hypothetical protein FJ938_22300 [Mesorhizobium sp. B2-4-14]|uniref:DUF6634 family protein n=1 Tax=Mesorhizobium sp. B2-4-14 TaxID=2589935 RepID=UPI001127BD73|nr:DUF6634 family protein [Mesorhizobium sp. B2-4-14]TPL00720.1 hypothetical protein FJ938_22300 [Mesorhizobium sp. B2-4-14]